MISVKLIAYTQPCDDDNELVESVVASAANLCYNGMGAKDILKDMSEEKANRLTKQMVDSGHHSTLEHVSFTFAIEGVSRACTHQLVRHRIASYCVSGDTKIRTSSQRTNNKTIRELFEMSKQYQDMIKVRYVNEQTKELSYAKPLEIVYSGVQEVFEIATEFGYKIKTTKLHKFFTDNGWQQLENLNVGNTVYVNGLNAYKNKEWLEEKYHKNNLSQKQIADLCGVKPITIRKWVCKHKLQKPLGSWSIGKEPPNKNKTKYNYLPLLSVSEKTQGNKNYKDMSGENNPMWKGGNVGVSGGYTRTHKMHQKQGICKNCLRESYTELHHIDKNPKNTKPDNVIELCESCHKAIHKKEILKVIIPNKIISIESKGYTDTYDIVMPDPYHNYIAEGFVVHNSQQSQRYVKAKNFRQTVIMPDSILSNNRAQAIFNYTMDVVGSCYNELLGLGIPSEDARFILPNATETKIVVTMNARSLLHFFSERMCMRAQWEIRELATQMLLECRKVAPKLFEKAGPTCVTDGYCREGLHSCGRITKFVGGTNGKQRATQRTKG